MAGLSNKTIKFLKDLKANNDRDWFNDNKPVYEASREEFIDFVDRLVKGIAKFDPSVADINPKKAAFRIYRDTRFSKDKSPYKTNFGAHLVANGAKPMDRAGYYLHIEPGQSMLAGGAYMPTGAWLKAIRQEIAYNAEEFRKILKRKSFKDQFGEMQGEQLKSAPRDYPKDHPEIELLRYKSFLAVHDLKDKEVKAADFDKHCLKVYKALKPFDDFLNRSMD